LDNFTKLLQEKNHTFIDLKHPYKKFKYKIWNISLRSILFMNVKDKIIPIFIAKKTNKKLWNNIILDSNFEELLYNKLFSINNDIKNWDFVSY
jgi:hypothetical protein